MRKRVEEPFGWGQAIGVLARPMLRGVKKLDFKFSLTMAAYDAIKLPAVDRGGSLSDKQVAKKNATEVYSGIVFQIELRVIHIMPLKQLLGPRTRP
jgi:hypothetical protein